MNDFQEQAKNWLRNVVKQNPDKIKAGVEKAGDLIDKQTGGKYADKVDAVQQKVGTFVDKQTPEDTPAAEPTESAGSTGAATSSTTQDAASSADTSGSSASADATSTDATSTDGSQR